MGPAIGCRLGPLKARSHGRAIRVPNAFAFTTEPRVTAQTLQALGRPRGPMTLGRGVRGRPHGKT
jgi:hypothetical protein